MTTQPPIAARSSGTASAAEPVLAWNEPVIRVRGVGVERSALLEKLGGDSMRELLRNLEGYRAQLAGR